MGLFSCERMEILQEGGREIKLTASLGEYATKVNAAGFESGDVIGLSIGEPVNATNVKLTYSNGALTPAQTLYWGEKQSKASSFWAVYPYNQAIDPGKEFGYEIPVNQMESPQAADLLIASASAAPGVKSVNLAFTHAFSRLVINLDNKTGAELAGVAVVGFYTKASVNIPENRIVAVASGNINESGAVATPLSNDCHAVVLAPQTVKPIIYVYFTDGKMLVFNAASEITFQSGKQLVTDLVLEGGEAASGDLTFTTRVFDWFPGEDLDLINYNPGDDPGPGPGGDEEWDYTPSDEYMDPDNLWRAADLNHTIRWYYAPGGVVQEGPEVTFTNNTYEFTIPDDTDHGQSTLYIIPNENIILDSSKQYAFDVVWESSALGYCEVRMNLEGVGAYLWGGMHGGEFETGVCGWGFNFPGSDIPMALVIDFGRSYEKNAYTGEYIYDHGTPAGTKIRFKDIVIREVGDWYKPDDPDPQPASDVFISVTDNTFYGLPLVPGESTSIQGYTYPFNATDQISEWKSSDANVITVGQPEVTQIPMGDGTMISVSTVTITAVGAGEATITATAGEAVGEYQVKVVAVPEGAVNMGPKMSCSRPDGTYYRFFWAACNLDATAPEEKGGYYAWGETVTKNSYSWNSYQWGRVEMHDINEGGGVVVVDGDKGQEEVHYVTKYCPSDYQWWGGENGILPDNKTQLDLEDDAAHVKLGGNWRIPSFYEASRLNVTWEDPEYKWEWTALNGWKVTYLGNGNSLFFPITGYYSKEGFINSMSIGVEGVGGGEFTDCEGFFWTSSLFESDPHYANAFAINSLELAELRGVYSGVHGIYIDGGKDRANGCPIRPITE